jgi:hypothetical protein
VTIIVTQKDIQSGRRRHYRLCPIAFAVGREYGTDDIHVTNRVIKIGNEAFNMPRSARRFVQRFDNGKPVKPFNFLIR